MSLRTALFLALISAFYCRGRVFCTELEPELSMKHVDDTCKHSRTRRNLNGDELIDFKALNKTAIEDYLKSIATAIPAMRQHVESINGKLYFPPKSFFYEGEKPSYAGKDVISGSGDDTKFKTTLDNFSKFRESNPEELWSENRAYGFPNYDGNTNENPSESRMPFPPSLHASEENNREDKAESNLHSDIYKQIENSDINTNVKHDFVNMNDFETRNPYSREGGKHCDDYCFNKFFGYVPQQPISSCHSHSFPKSFIIHFNSECSAHQKHLLNKKPHQAPRLWSTMF